MAQYNVLNVSLTNRQRALIRTAFKKKNDNEIQLSNSRIKSGERNKITVTTKQ